MLYILYIIYYILYIIYYIRTFLNINIKKFCYNILNKKFIY